MVTAALVVLGCYSAFVLVLILIGIHPKWSKFASAFQPWQTSLSAAVGFLAVVLTISAANEREYTNKQERERADEGQRLARQMDELFASQMEARCVILWETHIQSDLGAALAALQQHNTRECRNAVERMVKRRVNAPGLMHLRNEIGSAEWHQFLVDGVEYRVSWSEVAEVLNTLSPDSACSIPSGAARLLSLSDAMFKSVEQSLKLSESGMKVIKSNLAKIKSGKIE